ncbi:AAA family ATPase [Pseudarthrobacter sp. NIBRBAC000502771]|uniref:AAA family ATPase n=1 Tax=Pseudarthrobacter sp. NIBRBAC000502771 TaxID=2590774 RepID=UPI00113259B8|nr:AAA family ATPase [Pseudarthrobacter sp. NIBRBAC000502771]QDG64430.1 hypothetical protein NIBR502771_20370 [Pseudarthrobacter sp. NIBRBAC000502771]
MAKHGDWHIDALTIQNFRCFEYLEIDFHPSMTVLVGVNGAGKTSVLDAIAVMLSTILREFGGPTRGFALADVREIPRDLRSKDSVARMDRVFPVGASVHGTLAGEAHRWSRIRHSAKGRTTWADKNSPIGLEMARVWADSDQSLRSGPLLPVIALYGVERLTGVRKATGMIPRSRSGAYDAALEGQSDLSRLSAFIKALTFAEFVADRRGEEAEAASNQLRAITIACNTILEGTGWGNPEWSPVPEELTLTHGVHGTLPLSFLSSGIKIAAGLVVDLVSRMARANPGLGADELLQTVPGIVLIDEVDLHLHPSWQQRILVGLRSVFPLVQFVVTTHSPQVLSTVDAESIRVVDSSGVRRVEYSAGLRSDIVLQRILETRPEPSLNINHTLDSYMSLVESRQGRSTKAQELRREIDQELGGIANVPKLADADATIDFYEFDE